MTNHRLFISLVILLITLSQPVWATDWPTFNLLKADPSQLPKPQTIKVSHDPVYNKAKEYEAYPLAEILNKIVVPDSLKTDELVIVFTATDGYKVAMAYSDAIAEQGFIAFRDNGAENKKWLDFKFGKQTMTPAPFYLVWPKKGLDEWRYPWPFQLVSLSLSLLKLILARPLLLRIPMHRLTKVLCYSVVIVYVAIPLILLAAKSAPNLIFRKILPSTLRNRNCQNLYLMPMRTVPAPKCPILKASLLPMMPRISYLI